MKWNLEWNDLQNISRVLKISENLSMEKKNKVYQQLLKEKQLLFVSDLGVTFLKEYPKLINYNAEQLQKEMLKDVQLIAKIIKVGVDKEGGQWDKIYRLVVEEKKIKMNGSLGECFLKIFCEKMKLEKSKQYNKLLSDFKTIETIYKTIDFSNEKKCEAMTKMLSTNEKKYFRTWWGHVYIRWLQSQYMKKQRKRRRIVRAVAKIIMCVFGVAMIGLASIGGYLKYLEMKKTKEIQQQRNEQLLLAEKLEKDQHVESNQKDSPEESTEGKEKEGKQEEVSKDTKKVLGQYEKFAEEYADFFGWLKISGTSIDYPVMQSDYEGYYLDHDFTGMPSKEGAVFVDQQVSSNPKDNLIVTYGHNMKNGHIFGELRAYEDYDFAIEHQKIIFDTKYEEAVYEVVAVLKTRILYQDEEGYRYYQQFGYKNEKELNNLKEFITESRLFDMGKSIKYGDDILMLSTCEYSQENGRFVVVARKMDESLR